MDTQRIDLGDEYATQLDKLQEAYGAYLSKLADLAGLRRCSSWWEADGETRCQLVDGHDAIACRACDARAASCARLPAGPLVRCCPECSHRHRHRPAGATHAVVTW